MKRRPGRKFVERDHRKMLAVVVIIAALIMILLGITTLMTRENPGRAFVNRDGLSSAAVFPFVYTDEDMTLKTAERDGSVTAIDSSASSPIFDYSKNNIYYLKDNVLYKYEIKSKSRKILVGSKVKAYKLLNDRSAIIYLSSFGDLHLYNLTTSEDTSFTEENPLMSIDDTVKAGRTGFIYLDNLNRSEKTGTLYSRLSNGKTYKIAENVAVGSEDISKREHYISYESEGNLYITDIEGNPVCSAKNATGLADIKQDYLTEEISNESNLNEGVEMNYAIAGNKIIFFTGSDFTDVCENYERIIIHTAENGRLIYTVAKDDEFLDVMMTTGSETSKKIATVKKDTVFAWSEDSLKLYCLYNRKLTEVDVGENCRETEIATGVSKICMYPGKPFVIYSDALGNSFYILSSKQTAKVASGAERLYGSSDTEYLLLTTRKGSENKHKELDFVKADLMQKVSSDVLSVVAFNNDMSEILYLQEDALVLKNGENITTVDMCGMATPVEIKR